MFMSNKDRKISQDEDKHQHFSCEYRLIISSLSVSRPCTRLLRPEHKKNEFVIFRFEADWKQHFIMKSKKYD